MSKASAFLAEGARKPDTLRTNWSAAARTSSSVAVACPRSVLMLLHTPSDHSPFGGRFGHDRDAGSHARSASERRLLHRDPAAHRLHEQACELQAHA